MATFRRQMPSTAGTPVATMVGPMTLEKNNVGMMKMPSGVMVGTPAHGNPTGATMPPMQRSAQQTKRTGAPGS